ncbi:hypothetical protein EV702DRAFT_343801 [Suillus placidus]|uniref:Uncharacterized protein n=1 Tax=Suillus placidus TaxID=48579 RepID=A0A9P6ZU97_9AGAM|nr:hypothetical protein EV702DRAFT_343801 [Suillus placidus]
MITASGTSYGPSHPCAQNTSQYSRDVPCLRDITMRVLFMQIPLGLTHVFVIDSYLKKLCWRVMALPVDTKDNIPPVRSPKQRSLRILCPIRARPLTLSRSRHACGSAFLRIYSTVARTKWRHSFASGPHPDHIRAGILVIRQIIPRSHQCGDLRHLSRCSAHFLQLHFFRDNFYLAIAMQWAPLADSPECPASSVLFLDESFTMLFQICLPLALESTGYSDIQNSVAQIVQNCEHTSLSIKVVRLVRRRIPFACVSSDTLSYVR